MINIVNPSEPSVPLDTLSSPLNKLISAYYPDTKIPPRVLSTEPAFLFYTIKFIDVPEVKRHDGKVEVPAQGARSGFYVEPDRYINGGIRPCLRRGRHTGPTLFIDGGTMSEGRK
jgi:aldose 1-epimerase